MGTSAKTFLPDLKAAMALANPAQQAALRQVIAKIES
jgi:hypothetical protein